MRSDVNPRRDFRAATAIALPISDRLFDRYWANPAARVRRSSARTLSRRILPERAPRLRRQSSFRSGEFSTIIISGCGVSCWVGNLRRLDFLAPNRPDLALFFCHFAFVLVLRGRFAACFFGVFAFLATFFVAFLGALAFRAAARLVRLAITHSIWSSALPSRGTAPCVAQRRRPLHILALRVLMEIKRLEESTGACQVVYLQTVGHVLSNQKFGGTALAHGIVIVIVGEWFAGDERLR